MHPFCPSLASLTLAGEKKWVPMTRDGSWDESRGQISLDWFKGKELTGNHGFYHPNIGVSA